MSSCTRAVEEWDVASSLMRPDVGSPPFVTTPASASFSLAKLGAPENRQLIMCDHFVADS